MADNPHFNRIATAFQKAVNHIHRNKGYKPEMLADGPVRELITATCDTLTEPLHNIGLRQEVPPELTAAIDENTFYFSGFKTHHELVEASRLLKGDDGNFKPFEQFRRDVEAIDSTYNRNYLQAEYNFAAAASQMAVKWKEWEQDGDDYDLQYRTAGDDRVREEHAALNGITLPPSDPFWNSYLPPNGWNCRCTTVQVRKGKYPQSDPEEAAARGAACTARPKQQIFRFNPGKQQKIFPPKHPYFPKGCGNCQYKRLIFDNDKAICKACRSTDAAIVKWSRDVVREHYKKLIGDNECLVWEINNGIDKLTVKYQDIRTVTGKAHDYPYARNMAVYYLQTLMKQAQYLGNTTDAKGDTAKGHSSNTIWHYYSIPFMKKQSYLVVKEVDGNKYIHHIQDDNHFKEEKIQNKVK